MQFIYISLLHIKNAVRDVAYINISISSIYMTAQRKRMWKEIRWSRDIKFKRREKVIS